MSTEPKDDAPEPGINVLRLEAERSRDELESTLDELGERLNPRRVTEPVVGAAKSVARRVRGVDRTTLVAASTATVIAVGGVVAWIAKAARRNG
jgi:hypothetical protein